MSRTSDFSKNHPYAVARGWVSSGFAANSLDSVSDGVTEVDDVRALLISGGKVNDLDNGLAEITFGGQSQSSNSVGQAAAIPIYLRNNGPTDVIPGDVIVIDPTADSSFTTTSTASNTQIAGVVQAPIARLAYGPVLMAGSGGLASVINTVGTVSRGNFALTSATAGKAGATASRVAGSFGEYLTGTDLSDFVAASANTESGTTVTTLTLNMPPAIPAGRLLFLALWLETAASSVTISGWTRIGSTEDYWYFYKVSEGDDAAVPTWTTASVAVGTVLLLHPNVSLTSPIASSAYDSTTSAASVSGLSDAPRYAIAGVQANVPSPGSSFTRLGGGTSTLSSSGSTPSLVQAKSNVTFTVGNITLDSAVTPGNVLVAVIVDRTALGTPAMNESGWTLMTSAHATAVADGGSVKSECVIYARVATDSTASWTANGTAIRWRLYEIANANISDVTVLTTTDYSPGGTTATLDLGDFTSASGVAMMVMGETRGNSQANHNSGNRYTETGWTERYDDMIDPTQVFNDHIVLIADAQPSASTVDVAATYTETNFLQTIGRLGGCAVLFSATTTHFAAGTLAGKYIAHASSATSPFTGASQQNDAIFAVNLMQDAKASALLYGPDLGAGGASISVGSNSTDVAGITAMGATGAYADAAHWHKGVVAITSSSSNTLQRPMVNLRAGSGVAFGATDTDGNGEFDTLTISSTGAGGGGGGGTLPGWLSQFVGTTDSTHYYWDGNDLAGFTTQTVTGSATWSEARDCVSVLASNQTVDDAAVQLIAKTFATGDIWELAINTTILRSDVANSTAAYRAIGLVFADGTATTSNCIIGHLQIDNGAGGSTAVLVGRHGTLTNINTGAPWVSQDINRTLGNWIWIRLKYSAANTFQLSFANIDRNQYSAFGEADISKTMTPTHVGLFVSMQNAGTAVCTFGPLLKTA